MTDAQLLADAKACLADLTETVVYRPADGLARIISKAQVNRPEPIPAEPANRWEASPITVCVANDRATGIAADELDTGQDRLDVALRAGGERTTRPIVALVSQDAGILELQVR